MREDVSPERSFAATTLREPDCGGGGGAKTGVGVGSPTSMSESSEEDRKAERAYVRRGGEGRLGRGGGAVALEGVVEGDTSAFRELFFGLVEVVRSGGGVRGRVALSARGRGPFDVEVRCRFRGMDGERDAEVRVREALEELSPGRSRREPDGGGRDWVVGRGEADGVEEGRAHPCGRREKDDEGAPSCVCASD